MEVTYVFEALFVIVTDILLPTSDTFTDIFLFGTLVDHACEDDLEETDQMETIGWTVGVLLPILVNIGFT